MAIDRDTIRKMAADFNNHMVTLYYNNTGEYLGDSTELDYETGEQGFGYESSYDSLVNIYGAENVEVFLAELAVSRNIDNKQAHIIVNLMSEDERAAFIGDNGISIINSVKLSIDDNELWAIASHAFDIREQRKRSAVEERDITSPEQIQEETQESTLDDLISRALDSNARLITAARSVSSLMERTQGVLEQSVEFLNLDDIPDHDYLGAYDSTYTELREMYERCDDYERVIDELREELSECYQNADNEALRTQADSIEETIRILSEKLAELKRIILELIEQLKTAAKEMFADAIASVKADMEEIRTGLDIVKNDIKSSFARPEKTTAEVILDTVKKGDLVAFHQKINADTEGLPKIFAAALARNDKIGNAMTSRVLEALEKREIDKLTEVERSSADNINAAKSRALAGLKPTEVLINLIEDKKFVAAERLLSDGRTAPFLRSEQGGDVLYAALKSKNVGTVMSINPYLNFAAHNRALRLCLDNLDAKSAGNIIRLGANPDLFIKLTAIEDKSNPFLDDKQRRFMNDLTKFWNNAQVEVQRSPELEAEYGE